MDMNVWINPEV